MGSIGNTLYAALLRSHELERQRKLEQQRYDDTRYDKSMEQLRAAHDQSEAAKNAEFERKLKVAELMTTTAGKTGQQQPSVQPQFQPEATAAYGAGAGQRQLEAEKTAETNQTYAENQILGIAQHNNPYNDPSDETDRLAAQIYNQRGVPVKGPLVQRTTPPVKGGAGSRGGMTPEQRAHAEYIKLGPVKAMQEVSSNYNVVRSTPLQAQGGNGTSDISLLVAYTHMVEPDSIVREGEFDRAVAAGGFPGKAQGWALYLQGHGVLPDSIRADIKRDAERVLREKHMLYRAITKEYQDKWGADVTYGTGIPLDLPQGGAKPAPAQSGTTPKDEHYLNQLE